MSGVEPDPIFSDPRLVALYDVVDGERDDLLHYLAVVDEIEAGSVLDLGCGTGTLACALAHRGLKVVAVDPAAASVDFARSKPGAGEVRWIVGDVGALPALRVDLAVMTGNVAQVFLDDAAWRSTLVGVRAALRPGGHLVFETRVPARRAWTGWTPHRTRRTVVVEVVGVVETWTELVDVSLPLVSFRHSYRFVADGVTLTSDSTLRFRDRAEIEADLVETGYEDVTVRDAPDRPGRQYVFVARRASPAEDDDDRRTNDEEMT